MRPTLALALIALVPACSLPRAALGTSAMDGAQAGDVGPTELDAEDAFVPGVDAFTPDAPIEPIDTGPTCHPASTMETACDRIDEDCDGIVDDDDVCGHCIAFEALGHDYLSCPGPVSGFDAWAGACRRTAPGYDLAVFEGITEQRAALAALTTLRIADPHWIGLNDFETNASYVWRDRSTTFVPLSIAGDDPAKRFVALRSDGTYDSLTGTEVRRFLCEPVLAPGACTATTEPASCDGVDDDCDGVPDDGIPCGASMCVASPFWDHVYYLCARGRHGDQALGDCVADTGGQLTSVNGSTELAFLVRLSPNEAWVGLTQPNSQPTTDAGWRWVDGSMGYGVPATIGTPPWNTGEPNDQDGTENNQENCALLLAPARGSRLDDRACGSSLPFLCERPWTY